MTKAQRRPAPPPASMANLPARAAEALQQERFKEAVELYKQLLRQDPRPEWREPLADAYCGRARALAGKQMFKEAAMVLENTLSPQGTVRDTRLYVKCLLQDGQQPKAAAHLLHCIGGGFLAAELPEAERLRLEELAAALMVAVPLPPAPVRALSAETTRWRELAAASREAIAAWVDGASPEEIERHLNRISLRSAFRPVRLLLKALVTPQEDAERTRRLLDTIGEASPFFPLRTAVEAALRGGAGLDADGWRRLSAPQQSFVAETCGMEAAATQSLAALSEAARSGPAALFAALQKRRDLPQAEVRSACFNLLPQIIDRVPQFERSFGPLSELETARLRALSAEAAADWTRAEASWCRAAAAIAQGNDQGNAPGNAQGNAPGNANGVADRNAQLSQGVIYRHLAFLAQRYPRFEGVDDEPTPAISYLKRSCKADPEHVPTVLELIAAVRKEAENEDKWDADQLRDLAREWHRLADDAAQRFPDDSQVLLQATESAIARKAFKKAAGFARRLLKMNSINSGVRRQLIELHVAHARKQMLSKRPDLAEKELADAAEWDRPDAPSAALRIARGLIALHGDRAQADVWLREGVALAGGGAAGWFRVVLEATLMKCPASEIKRLREELQRAQALPSGTIPAPGNAPTKDAVMAVISTLAQPALSESKRALTDVVRDMRGWLGRAADTNWSAEEFAPIAELFGRFELWGLLMAYAQAGRRREPDNPEWRFQEIVARTEGDSRRMYVAEEYEINEIVDGAFSRGDAHAQNRLRKYLKIDTRGARHMRVDDMDDVDGFDGMDPGAVIDMFQSMMGKLPKGMLDDVRVMVRDIGREAAIQDLMHRLGTGPAGVEPPDAVMRIIAESMVDRAMGGGAGRRGRF